MNHSGQLTNEATIDELAAQTGVPSRTIREYQRLDLLPPPRRDGRVGRYGDEHRARLSIVGRLQDRGYSLAAIGDLLGSWEQGRGLGAVLGVDANPAVLDETPTEFSSEQFLDLFPAFSEPGLLADARAAGLIHSVDGDKVLVRSVAAVEFANLVIDQGMPCESAIDIAATMSEGAALIAASAVDHFVEHLWPRRSEVDLHKVLSRARLLLAQASASLVVHELAAALNHQAGLKDADELEELVGAIAIGQIRRLTPSNEST